MRELLARQESTSLMSGAAKSRVGDWAMQTSVSQASKATFSSSLLRPLAGSSKAFAAEEGEGGAHACCEGTPSAPTWLALCGLSLAV